MVRRPEPCDSSHSMIRAFASSTPSPSRLTSLLAELIAGPSPVKASPSQPSGRLHGPHDRQAEPGRELPVALVLAGHRHDRAGAVAHQHVVGDEHRDHLVGDRVGGEGAGEDAGLVAALGLPLQVGAQLGGPAVGLDRVAGRRRSPGPGGRYVGGPGAGGHLVQHRVLGRDDHEGGAEQRVRPGREDLDRAGIAGEPDPGALGAADPVALLQLDRLRPVQLVQVGQQPRGVGGDPHHPLAQVALEDREVAAVAAPLGGDLLVGQHRAQAGAPVDRRVRQVDQPVRVDDPAAVQLVQVGPRDPGRDAGDVRRHASGAGGQQRLQLGDRPGPPRLVVVPAVVDLQEDPLGPAVELGVGGRHAASAVVRQPQPAQLLAHRRDVRLGGDPRVLPGLHGVLLGGQAEGVVAQRVQHVVPGHPLEPAVHVGGDVAQRVPDVQPDARRVREHVQHVALRPGRDLVRLGQRAGRVGRLEGALGVPPVLPAGLDLCGQRSRVAVRRVALVSLAVGSGCVGHLAPSGGLDLLRT